MGVGRFASISMFHRMTNTTTNAADLVHSRYIVIGGTLFAAVFFVHGIKSTCEEPLLNKSIRPQKILNNYIISYFSNNNGHSAALPLHPSQTPESRIASSPLQLYREARATSCIPDFGSLSTFNTPGTRTSMWVSLQLLSEIVHSPISRTPYV